MKIAYICCPNNYYTDRTREEAYARSCVKWAFLKGYAPICPRFCIDPAVSADIEKARKARFELIRVCDVVIVGTAFNITNEMLDDMQEAVRQGKGNFIEFYKT